MSLLVLAFMIVSLLKIYFVLCVLVFCLHVHLCMLLWFGCDFSRRSSVGPLRSRRRGGGKFLGHCRRPLEGRRWLVLMGAHGSPQLIFVVTVIKTQAWLLLSFIDFLSCCVTFISVPVFIMVISSAQSPYWDKLMPETTPWVSRTLRCIHFFILLAFLRYFIRRDRLIHGNVCLEFYFAKSMFFDETHTHNDIGGFFPLRVCESPPGGGQCRQSRRQGKEGQCSG